MADITYFTKEGLEKLKKELQHLKSVERPSISKQIAEARDKGDLSENAEYDAAKEAQGLLELKIRKTETLLSNARLIDSTKVDTSIVQALSKVKVKNHKTGALLEYTLVSENEQKQNSSLLFWMFLLWWRAMCSLFPKLKLIISLI